jgi:hypothetical protein
MTIYNHSLIIIRNTLVLTSLDKNSVLLLTLFLSKLIFSFHFMELLKKAPKTLGYLNAFYFTHTAINNYYCGMFQVPAAI